MPNPFRSTPSGVNKGRKRATNQQTEQSENVVAGFIIVQRIDGSHGDIVHGDDAKLFGLHLYKRQSNCGIAN